MSAGLRLAGLLTLVAAVLLALTAGSASAASVFKPIGEITGPEAGVPFGSLRSESVAVDDADGHILIADSSDGTVYDFSSITDTSATKLTGFGTKVAVAVDDASGDFYVSDSTGAVIKKFEADGTPIAGWATGGELTGSETSAGSFAPAGIGSFGITVDQQTHDLYVIDAGHEVVDVFDEAGTYLPANQITATPEGLYNEYVDGIAVDDKSGEVLVSTSQNLHTYRFDRATGAFIAMIDGSETPGGSFGGGFTSVAADNSTGQIYINDSEHKVVDAYNPDATYSGTQITETLGGEFGGVAVDQSTSDVYVSDPATGAIKVFEALPLPGVVTKPASQVTTTTATLHGEVNPAGLEVEECVFEYGLSSSYGQTVACEESTSTIGTGASPVPVEAKLEGLISGVTYHFRLSARNENGTNKAVGDQTFFTGAGIDSTSASGVTATSATLETELNPHGLPTNYRFEYDTSPYTEGGLPHGSATPTAGAGSGTVDVFRSAQIQGLQPLTTYYYRVVAENSLGTATGPDHVFTTQGAAASLLPDGRAWELVTPPNKHGAPVEPIPEEYGLTEAAREGGAFTEVATGPLGPESPGVRSPQINQWLSTRSPDGGWSTEDITTPREQVSEVQPGEGAEYVAFSEDLHQAIVQPLGPTPLSPQTSEPTPYRREADGEYVPLVVGCPASPTPCPSAIQQAANVPPGTEFGGEELVIGGHILANGVHVLAATPDAQHVVLESPQLLTEEFEPGFESNARPNLYELSGRTLQLISILPDGKPMSETGLDAGLGHNNEDMRNAVSDNGTRVFVEAESHLYLRDTALEATVQLDLPQGGSGGSGAAVFQGASADGSKVFFTDTAKLTEHSSSAPNAPDLYMCEVGEAAARPTCRLSDLSVDPNSGEAAQVTPTVSAIDPSGTQVFFAAHGVLTNAPNPRGERAAPGSCGGEGTCNLYVYDTVNRDLRLVAVLAGTDEASFGAFLQSPLKNLTARTSPNGRYFAFMSTRSLTGYDNRDVRSGQPDAEVYLFDTATSTLRCVSCNPTGARPQGVFDPAREAFPGLLVDYPRSWRERWLAASIPGWTPQYLLSAPYQSRYLSNSGRLFFTAADALVPQDTNGVMDVYEYEPPGVGSCTPSSATYGQASGGCVGLISSGTSPEESAFLDADEEGENVFFLTQSRLTPKDTDGALDVYDARVGGGEPTVVNPPACTGDACQLPATPPAHPTPGTALLNGPGNLLQCPKGKVKQKGKCVKKQQKKKAKRKKKGHKKSSKQKGKKQTKAGSKHGGQK